LRPLRWDLNTLFSYKRYIFADKKYFKTEYMSAIDLEIQKLRFIKEFLSEEDEDVVKKQLSFFYETKHGVSDRNHSGISRFKGLLTTSEADQYHQYLQKTRQEWDRDI
jgi:hypothetical protein